jgi:serine phosphatase RsbU (regulator of sigma subunit)
MTLNLSFKTQLVLIFTVFTFFIILLSNFLIFDFSKEHGRNTVMSKALNQFYERENFFLIEMERYKAFALSFTNSKLFQEVIKKNNKPALDEIFMSRLEGEKDIFRLRFIDNNGQEISSIRKKNGIVGLFNLQNKSHRYYIKETYNLKKGEVFFSRLDLNRDFGKLEFPIRPTMRIITPIYIENKKYGVLVVNISMEDILKAFSNTSLYNIGLIDKDGEFICYKTENSNYSWSRYLDNKSSFKDYLPKEYRKILSQDEYIGDDFFIKKMRFNNNEEIRIFLKIKESIIYSNSMGLLNVIKDGIFITIAVASLMVFFIIYIVDRVKKEHERELNEVNTYLKESINVASIIQSSILPSDDFFEENFYDYFIYYEPKDIVSGDIYLMRNIADKEFIIMVVDCTGHGVSGAFLTMFVKAIAKDLLHFIDKEINDSKNKISTSHILSIFNRQIKELLKQQDKSSQTYSDFGCDGTVLYINRKENIAKYSGANSPMYIAKNGKVEVIKANKHSIGYKKSDSDYIFDEKIIDLSQEQTIYITTDGFIDQLGGDKGFSFAKKKFIKLIENNSHKSLKEQKNIFIDTISKYQANYENTDDRTVVALKFK